VVIENQDFLLAQGNLECEIRDGPTRAVSFFLKFPAHLLLNGKVVGTHTLRVAALGKLLGQMLRQTGML